MTGSRFIVGEAVFDRDREAGGEVLGLYPSPLVVRLADAGGFQWIARTVACERAGARSAVRPRAGDGPGVQVPAEQVVLDLPPTEPRVGDQIRVGGRLVAIADLRYRYGGTRTMILRNGTVTVAERTVRVYRPRAG